MEVSRNEEGTNMHAIFIIRGDWNKQSNALKINYPHLTNEDVYYEVGKESELFNRLERKLGKNRSEVIGILKSTQERVF